MTFIFWIQKMTDHISDHHLKCINVATWFLHSNVKKGKLVYFIKYLKILVNQQNSKSNKLIKVTRAIHPYITFTGKPPVSQANLPPGSRPNGMLDSTFGNLLLQEIVKS